MRPVAVALVRPDAVTDKALAARLRRSGTRSVRGAQAELNIGRSRAQRVVDLAWPDSP